MNSISYQQINANEEFVFAVIINDSLYTLRDIVEIPKKNCQIVIYLYRLYFLVVNLRNF